MNIPLRIAFFREMVQTCFPIYFWIYDFEGNLIETDCPYSQLQGFFEKSGLLDYLYEREDHNPVCLGSFLGLLWGAVFAEQEGAGEEKIYLIGPVVNTEVSEDVLKETVQRIIVKKEDRELFVSLFEEIPVVSMIMMQNFILMLQRCVTGETLLPGDIHYMDIKKSSSSESKKIRRDRRKTYQAEQQLLDHVRKGDMNYQKAHTTAAQLSGGTDINGREPKEKATLSSVIFTTLCTRAAIEGGISADTAYTIGDAYIEAALNTDNLSEIRSVNRRMLEDFIQRVHAAKQNSGLSKPIRDCCEYIRMHTEEDLSLSALASLFGYSEYYLSRKFRKETGETIGEYIGRIRIERAKLLLETTDTPIGEIAETLRFCSSTHFSTAFRRYTGILPREYRLQKQDPL